MWVLRLNSDLRIKLRHLCFSVTKFFLGGVWISDVGDHMQDTAACGAQRGVNVEFSLESLD
jgi:hypothetical protein